MADTNTHRGRELGVLSEQKVPRQTLGNVIYNDVGRFFHILVSSVKDVDIQTETVQKTTTKTKTKC